MSTTNSKSTNRTQTPTSGNSDIWEALQRYQDYKFSTIPIVYQDKRPLCEWKDYQYRRANAEELEEWFGNGQLINIGIVCGEVSGNLIVIDFDSLEKWEGFMAKVAELFGKSVYELTPLVGTDRGFHVYLRTKVPVSSLKLDGVDIKGEGGYVVAPPSIHPSGAEYRLINPAVTQVLEIDSLSEIGITAEKIELAPPQIGWVDKALEGVSEGERDNTCIRLAGHYKAQRLGYDETLVLLRVWGGRCNPLFPDREVEKCVKSAYGYLQREAHTQAEALAEARRIALKWLKLKDVDVIDIALAIVVANKATGDPVWMIIVAAPSTGKTEILRALFGCDNVHPLGGFTANTFASGYEKDGVSLLKTIADHTTLVVKDFGSLLTMRREDRAIILQQFREIYDGQYRKEYGNGKVVEWKGTMGLLAAGTSAIENYHAVVGELGNRYILYRCDLDEEDRDEVALKALTDEGAEKEMRAEIGEAFQKALDKAGRDVDRVTIPEPLRNKIASLANVTAQCRSTVSRDAYDKHVNYQPDIEGPARLAKAFAKLLKGLAVVRGKHEVTVEEYDLIVKVALDTIPRRRRAIVSYLVGSDWRNTKTIATDLQLPSTTAQYELEDLMLIKVVNREADVADGDELRQTTPYKWHLSENVARLIEDTGLKAVI